MSRKIKNLRQFRNHIFCQSIITEIFERTVNLYHKKIIETAFTTALLLQLQHLNIRFGSNFLILQKNLLEHFFFILDAIILKSLFLFFEILTNF